MLLIKRFALTCLLMIAAGAVSAESFVYEEGTHYARLEVPVKTRHPDKVVVTEYFSYACPHCYEFEPLLQKWKEELPDNVIFDRSPAIWRAPGYELFARTYYTADALGVLEDIHTPFFQAIHSTPLSARNAIDLEWVTRFMAEQGVDPTVFVKTFNDSFGVKAQYQQANARQRVYRAVGVPSLIVNGKYRIETTMHGGSKTALLEVADYLIKQELALLNGSAPAAE